MAKSDIKRDMKAMEFITGAKEEFKKFILRDHIDGIEVTECAEKDGVFVLSGPVCVTSPTGKEKTYGYTAAVKVADDGECSLEDLKVVEP